MPESKPRPDLKQDAEEFLGITRAYLDMLKHYSAFAAHQALLKLDPYELRALKWLIGDIQ